MVMLLRSTRKIRFLTLIAYLPPAGSALVDIVDSRRQARGHTHNELGDHRRSRARPNRPQTLHRTQHTGTAKKTRVLLHSARIQTPKNDADTV